MKIPSKILYKVFKDDICIQRSYSLHIPEETEVKLTDLIRDDLDWYKKYNTEFTSIKVYLNNELYKTLEVSR